MKTLLVVSLFVLLFLTHAFSQSPAEMKAAGEAERAAVKAYQAKDYAGFLMQMVTANKNRPNHPRLIYNLASANAVNGNADQALALLERLGNMGLAFAVEKDDDFKDISATERFKKILARFAENRKPVNTGQKALTAKDKELIVEGIAFDQKTKSFYLASVHQRKIVKIDKNGVATDFSNPADGLWGVYGIRIDAERGWLWVSSLASIANRGLLESDKNKSGIFRYDLKTGKLLKKYIVPGEERHALGDLIIAGDGRVFSTDSAAATIYTIDPKTDELQVFLNSDMLASPEGLTLDGSGNMFVADYSKGIFRIDTKTKRITQLIPAADITLLGIDGLYFYKGNLIAIQNGINPHRVVHFTVDGGKITHYKTLEANHADFNEPTLGNLIGETFYFNANSQFGLFNPKGELATDKLRQPVILKIDLKKALVK